MCVYVCVNVCELVSCYYNVRIFNTMQFPHNIIKLHLLKH